MIPRVIEFSVRNRYLVILLWAAVAMWGVYAVVRTPVDAIPDLSENQVIVFTDWMGRSPQEIEDQITYPLSVQLQGLAGVKAVRSSSEFNFSMINVIFDDKTDYYFARTRVLERLSTARAALPPDVTPQLAPDATALGQIFWYTVEGGGESLDQLRALQDFTIRYQLNAVPGVAEVASVGGFVREYQIDVNPDKLRLYNLPLSAIATAVADSNLSVGGKTIDRNNTEYVLRGIGWLTGLHDLDHVVVTSRSGVPITLSQVATVQLGPAYRRSALEKNGGEAVGGVVMMRYGENPLAVTQAVKQKIRELSPGLPAGVRIVPFYDRTRLIESAIHTVTGTLIEEIVIASLAILLILGHVRSAVVVCVTLPMAVLISFLLMYYLGIPSNIMSLCGIAISIGILVDAAVVMVENATHELREHATATDRKGRPRVTGDTADAVVRACRLVGRPIFFSVLIMLLSFLPVFAFGGQEGKLSHPLAFTKSFAMIGVALLAITLVPALIPIFIRGRLKSEEDNWIVRSFIHIYRPTLDYLLDRPGAVWWLMGVLLALAAALVGSPLVSALAVALGLAFVMLGVRSIGWKAVAAVSLVVIALVADTRLPHLGSEFMPELNEGSLLDMPTTAPRVAMAEAIDDVSVRDRILRSFPEVEQVVGKIGRADTATDPSPTDMVETVVTFQPKQWWPKRKVMLNDATRQGAVVAKRMAERGWLRFADAKWTPEQLSGAILRPDAAGISPDLARTARLVQTSSQAAVDEFDRSMRSFATRRWVEYEPDLASDLAGTAADAFLAHLRGTRHLLRAATPSDRAALVAAALPGARLIAHRPLQPDADRMLGALRAQAVKIALAPDRSDLLVVPASVLEPVTSLVSQPADLAAQIFRSMQSRRQVLLTARIKSLDWEIFDHAPAMLNDYLIEQLGKSAAHSEFAGEQPTPGERHKLRDDLTPAFAKSLFLWQKTKPDVQAEMNSELQMPGWGNAWTQPIINRVNMLATGVRTQIGIKVFGPPNKPLRESLAQMQDVSNRIAATLKQLPGAVDVFADQALGKRYIDVEIDRRAAARYGVNVADINQAVEVAMGGKTLTTTVEGRERFPVTLRYARDFRQDPDALKNILVTGSATPARLYERAPATPGNPMPGQMEMGKSAPVQPTAEPGSAIVQVPLSLVADVRFSEGPAMVKSENGRLRNYVLLNVRGRDLLGFVNEAQQALKPLESSLAGTGMSIEWTGEFENQLRARQTLTLIFPLVILCILFLLYVTFHTPTTAADGAGQPSFAVPDTLLVFLAVIGALCGSVLFQGAFAFPFSVIVSLGYVAAFGMATQTAVIMLTYLRDALARAGDLTGIAALADLRQAVLAGAVHRLRPKLLTEGVAIVGLVPMLWATGTGAEIMRPMAAPVLGGLLIADEVIDLMIPVLFYHLRKRQWLAMHRQSAASAESNEAVQQPLPAAVIP